MANNKPKQKQTKKEIAILKNASFSTVNSKRTETKKKIVNVNMKKKIICKHKKSAKTVDRQQNNSTVLFFSILFIVKLPRESRPNMQSAMIQCYFWFFFSFYFAILN